MILLALALTFVTAKGSWWVETWDFFPFSGALLVHTLLYIGAIMLVLRRPPAAGTLVVILVTALVLRAIAMTAPVNLTTDILRYVWDGRIQLGGFNPFLHVPADPALAAYQGWDQFPNINQKDTSVTIYPPVAEMVFLLSAALFDTIDGMRLVMAAFEGVTIWALIRWLGAEGLPRERVVIYAWHPLPIWEFSSQGHIDSVAVAFMMLMVLAVARQRQGLAGVALGFAFAAKYFPIVIVPALWRRWDWRMPVAAAVTAALLYMPYAWSAGPKVIGFLNRYLDNEGYGAGYGFHIIWLLRDFAIGDMSGRTYTAIALAILAALALWALFARRAEEIRPEALVILAAAFIWLTSPHYPWYFGWVIPLLVRRLYPSVLLFSLLAVAQNIPGDESSFWLKSSAFYLGVFGLSLVAMLAELGWRLAEARRERRYA
jgi:hypothetical protein